jgi:hypothetical protein
MRHTRLWLSGGAVVLSAVLAFFLRDVIYALIITPLAYLWWLFRSVYSLIPQLVLWISLLVGLTMLIMINFAPEGRRTPRPEEKRKKNQGQVEALAVWFARSNRGNYFKWQIANRLGLIARGFWGTPTGSRPLHFDDPEVDRYLEAGLNSSFVDYPPPKNRFQKAAPTPLDLDPLVVVDYLEKQTETARVRHP